MNEAIEYAEMLEIPLSTVHVARKRRRKSPSAEKNDALPLKESVIAQVNERLDERADSPDPLALDEGRLDFDPSCEHVYPQPFYTADEKKRKKRPFFFSRKEENEGGRYALNEDSEQRETPKERAARITLASEFALACAFCSAIFLTNVFLPNSAINVFFRALNEPIPTSKTDDRSYADFTLSPVVSARSDAELQLSETGILTFQDACCVYPAANGKIGEIQKNGDRYAVKIEYSDSFSSVVSGLDSVYFEVGDKVFATLPFAYTKGESEVQVTMYSDGELLNCFELTEENCLAWSKTE